MPFRCFSKRRRPPPDEARDRLRAFVTAHPDEDLVFDQFRAVVGDGCTIEHVAEIAADMVNAGLLVQLVRARGEVYRDFLALPPDTNIEDVQLFYRYRPTYVAHSSNPAP